jgi:hypothetical protein
MDDKYKEDICNKRARGMRTKSLLLFCVRNRNFFEKKTVLNDEESFFLNNIVIVFLIIIYIK